MENSENIANGGDVSKRKPKHRSRRGKRSTVSARLNPNFDPKEAAMAHIEDKNDELDPKTMKFDELVNLLHPTFISDYLQKILLFLKGDQNEICFPNIAPYKEAFLLKISEDNRNLHCNYFNEVSKNTAAQIFNVLNANKTVYKWIHKYESGRISKNILVYKKQQIDKLQNGHIPTAQSNGNAIITQSICSTSTPASLASSFEDLSLQQSRQDVPTGFKIQILNSTLKFIKDDNRLTLEYPEMSISQAEFTYNLLHRPDHKLSTLDFGFKSLYSPLYEAMQTFSALYEFKVSFLNTYSEVTARLVLRKIPKYEGHTPKETNDTLHSITSADLNTSTSTDASDSLNRSTKLFRSKREMIYNLPVTFIRSSLERVLDFITDVYKASLQFPNISVLESRFVECIVALSRRKECYQLFPEDCIPLLKRITRAYGRDSWHLRLDVGKLSKRTRLRTVTMYKVPRSEGRQDNHSTCSFDSNTTGHRSTSKERSWPDKEPPDSAKNGSNTANSLKHTTTDGPSNGPNNDSSKPPSVSETQKPNKKTPAITDTPRNRSISKDRRNQPLASIAFQSAGAQVLEDIETNVAMDKQTDEPRPEWALLATRRRRLFEAMSTPMESDRAERMMRLMGWEGGALGLRGEGITEPIIPPLHISPGAGLGHIKQRQRSAPEFRQHLLRCLLAFIRAGERETTIRHETPLTKREARFIRPAIEAFNQGKQLGLGLEEEVTLVTQILEELQGTDIRICCSISSDKKEITLLKTTGRLSSKNSKKKKKQPNPPESIQTPAHNLSTDITTDHMDRVNQILQLEHGYKSSKSAKALAYKIMFFENLKAFLQSEDMMKEYKFDCILNTKQKNFIQSLVNNLNRKAKASYNTETENEMYRDLRNLVGDCLITVVFDTQSFIVQKRCYQKRFTNSALDLPAPKSTDLNNTIIYKNNTIVNINGNDCNECVHNDNVNGHNGNGSDDDVILLTNSMEIIEISDEDEIKTRSVENTESDSVPKTTDSSGKCIDTEMRDVDEDGDGTLSKDIDVVSNESLLLDMLEIENNLCIKQENVSTDSELEKDIRELEKTILDSDTQCNVNDISVKKEFNESLDVKNETSPTVLEINNNYNLIKNKNSGEVKAEKVEDVKEPRAGSSKRTKLDSENTVKLSKKYNNVHNVCITHKSVKMCSDIVKQVQNKISECIDQSKFLPLLKCHGLRNDGLIYSCFNDESLVWLENLFINDNDIVVMDTDFCETQKYKFNFKINCVEDVGKVLQRLMLYNPGVDTSVWEVMDRQTYEDYMVISVIVDSESFEIINRDSFSLFAGVDVARFSIIWD